jgi:hypothetical protein
MGNIPPATPVRKDNMTVKKSKSKPAEMKIKIKGSPEKVAAGLKAITKKK